jgi:uncharacterized protein YndB with AHSA1/START domain
VSEPLGTVHRDGDRLSVRIERRYAATVEEVWRAFTDPASIKRWLFADAVLEPEPGGRFALRWSADEQATGEVRAWKPPHLLELTWVEAGGASVVHVEISADGDGALLVLEHRDVSAESAGGLGAGWHAHLAALADLLAGGDAIADRWRPRFDELHPRYRELVEAT